jgi:hypothetical protein
LGVATAIVLEEARMLGGLGGSTTSERNSNQLVSEARTKKKRTDTAEIPCSFGLRVQPFISVVRNLCQNRVEGSRNIPI